MVRTIVSIIGIVVAGLVFFGYTQTTYDNVHVLQAEIERYNQALDKAAELQKRRDELQTRFNSFDPNAKVRLQKMVPDHVDNIRLILDIDSLAGRFGMALQNVVISSPTGEGNDQTVIGAISTSKQKYESLTLKFSIHSTYANFVRFMEEIESSLRIVEMVSLTIAPEGVGGGGATSPAYKYDITIRTFWLR
ncbi:MAG: type 4a pilus biogenesis protein PilO [bacterium]|nr:type 4a pilus biogenesis protein PilO [bacterium]